MKILVATEIKGNTIAIIVLLKLSFLKTHDSILLSDVQCCNLIFLYIILHTKLL